MRVCLRSLFVVLATLSLRAQTPLISLASEVAGSTPPPRAVEIWRLGANGVAVPFLPAETWPALVGDRDQNGRLDDTPTNVDAFEVVGPRGLPDWLFSFAVNTTLSTGLVIRDGDVVRFDGQGGVQIVYSEDWFAQITGATTIDVDALAIAANGDLYFSFEDDEATTLAALVAQNGGNATLDEQCVFRIAPGASEATLHLTQSQVAALFNQALGTSVSTVVDVNALAIDPASGNLVLSSASTSTALRGRLVVSTGGGTAFAPFGSPFDPATLGFGSPQILDALAFLPGTPHPVLRALPDAGSHANGEGGHLRATGLVPGHVLQLVVTEPSLPAPFSWQSSGISGFGAIFPDPNQAMFYASLLTPAWQLTADALGVIDYPFDFGLMTSGAQAVVQGVDRSTLVLTNPVVVTVLP